jgi:hypothetical protein
MRRLMKLTRLTIIIEEYHCYQLHTQLYPRPKRDSNPESSIRALKAHVLDRAATGSVLLGIVSVYFDIIDHY